MVSSFEPWVIGGLALLFWTALTVLFYSYVGYPALVSLAARLRTSADPTAVTSSRFALPRVTVLIAAYNAEQHISDRIKNILACDYPRDRLDVLVASDGSTDATLQLVRALGDDRVRAVAFPERRGKTKTLVDAVQLVDSDVILFTDATNRFDQHSIRQLARHFANPRVGIATGRVSLIDEQGEPVESVYWKTEMMIRRSEIRLGIMLGANGPIYAIRRNLFVAPQLPVINDDFVLPMLAHLRHQCEVVYEESARAYMLSSGGLAGEFQRRCRIGAGAYQSLSVLSELFQRRHLKHLIAFTSHKLLRWSGPFLLVVLLVANLFLIHEPGYQTLLWMQAFAYLLAVIGLFVPNRGWGARLARTPASFVVLNLALLAGFCRWVAEPSNVIWSPTARPSLDKIMTQMHRELS